MKKIKFFALTIILIIIDQISKYLVILNIKNMSKQIIPNILDFTYCENRGIAFGMGSGHVKIVCAITLIIIIAIMIIINKNFKKINKLELIGIASIIAGGIGNLIDRFFRAYVVDFIDFGRIVDFPVFNIADICVVLGVFVIGIGYILDNRGEKVEKDNR